MDRMLVHRRVTHQQFVAYSHLHAEQYYLKITSKTWFLEQDLSTPIHVSLGEERQSEVQFLV